MRQKNIKVETSLRIQYWRYNLAAPINKNYGHIGVRKCEREKLKFTQR